MIPIRQQFCEWFQYKAYEAAKFMSKTVWFDEATFKLNCAVNYCNCVHWAPENPHIHLDKMVNLLGLSGVDRHTGI
jgi:hypothetical protein